MTGKGKATRSRLLQAAEAEFGARGHHEASVVGIAARALVSTGTFYLYFVSKEEIFGAVLSDVGDRVRAVLGDGLQGGPEAAVGVYVRAIHFGAAHAAGASDAARSFTHDPQVPPAGPLGGA